MSWLASALLFLIHALYRLYLVFKPVFRSNTEPLPITAERSKLPQHLAVAFISYPKSDTEDNEQYILNSVEKVAGWCRAAGIPQLSVYDRDGILARSSLELRRRLQPSPRKVEPEESQVDCDIRYPLTPPPSDDADSRPLSPESLPLVPKLSVTTICLPIEPAKHKRRVSALRRRRVPSKGGHAASTPLALHILSYQSGKPAIAATANMFLNNIRQSQTNDALTTLPSLPSIPEVNAVLEGEHGFPSPDLTIVHRRLSAEHLSLPAEMGGFPPWQSRLTEIYWERCPAESRPWRNSHSTNESSSIEESEFRRALDEFAHAEMRLGK
ncbi:hypothetical protein BC628DRAFT_1375259 [Trametes gibbosa]|nr:hypothetical protein BC628DRAFT_1375259 [Trametes gibbosa]